MIRPVRIVLVRPRDPGNIGACARAMANFGLRELVVLDPYEPIWQETRSAPEAEDVVLKAQRVMTWDEAVKGCSLVLGTSSFHQRSLEQAGIELPNLNGYLASFPASEPLAIVFGSERSGLSNDELSRCQAVIHIPTKRETPSMNLAQAVAVVLYEHRRAGWEPPAPAAPVPAQELEVLVAVLDQMGQKLDYPPGYENAARLGRIRQALQPAILPPATVRYLLSFLRKIERKLATGSPDTPMGGHQ